MLAVKHCKLEILFVYILHTLPVRLDKTQQNVLYCLWVGLPPQEGLVKRVLTEEQKAEYARRAREYRERKKSGVVLPKKVKKSAEKIREAQRERSRRYREAHNSPTDIERNRRYREKKKFQRWCRQNLIACPDGVGNVGELLEYHQTIGIRGAEGVGIRGAEGVGIRGAEGVGIRGAV